MGNKRKILLIAYDLNPKLGSECGVAFAWLRIIAKSYSVCVITDEVHKEDILSEGMTDVEFHFVNVGKKLRRFARRFGVHTMANSRFIYLVKKRLKQLDISEYCAIHSITPLGIHSYNDLHKLGIPVIVGPVVGGLPTPRGFESLFKGERLRDWLRLVGYKLLWIVPKWREYFLNAKIVVVGNEKVMALLPGKAFGKCRIIHDSIADTVFFAPHETPHSGEPVRIFFAGQLVNRKGVMLLLESTRMLVASGTSDFSVTIAGDGPLKTKLQEFVDEFSLGNNIKFIGKIGRLQMREMYQNCDIFCLPTLRDDGGNVILEAMACGLPIITSDYGGPGYMVTEKCGIKIKMVNPEKYVTDLAEAMKTLIKDPVLRKSLGDGARSYVEDYFSIHSLEKKVNEVFRELTA